MKTITVVRLVMVMVVLIGLTPSLSGMARELRQVTFVVG